MKPADLQETSRDWHGYSVGRKSLHVGELPGRKQVCLYVLDCSTIRTLAFFASEDKAAEALDMLDKIANATEVRAAVEVTDD